MTDVMAETMALEAPVYNRVGEQVGTVELDGYIFGIEPNLAVMHQALRRQRANAHLGTHQTKTRGQVRGGGRKPWRQKGTGRARQGSRRAPHWRGGGVVFGPHPRSYRQAMPKKMRQLAIRCVLSAKAGENEFMVLDELKIDEPKTKEMVKILAALKVNTSALIATSEPEANVVKSARNLTEIDTIPANLLNVNDILSHKMLLMTENAVHKVEQLWGGEAS